MALGAAPLSSLPLSSIPAAGGGGGATTTQITLSPVAFAYTPNSLIPTTKRPLVLSPASFAFTPNSITPTTVRKAVLSPVSFAYSANDLSVTVQQSVTYAITLNPVSFSFAPKPLTLTVPNTEFTGLGPGWGERTYRLEWRDRKWVKRKEREDELSNLIRQVYARLSGETPEAESEETESVETAAAEVAEVLAPYKSQESIDWEGLENNARAIADLEDALEAYVKARDEEEDWLLLTAA